MGGVDNWIAPKFNDVNSVDLNQEPTLINEHYFQVKANQVFLWCSSNFHITLI